MENPPLFSLAKFTGAEWSGPSLFSQDARLASSSSEALMGRLQGAKVVVSELEGEGGRISEAKTLCSWFICVVSGHVIGLNVLVQ